MAFETLKGRRVVQHSTDQTFIISDYFSVFNKADELPRIYRWSDVTNVAENREEYAITAAGTVYHIYKDSVPDVKKQLKLRAVLEGAISANPSIVYTHTKRILPPKSIYQRCDTPDGAYIAMGTYNEKEINAGNVILMQSWIKKILWFVSIISAITIFFILHFSIGETQKNWFYFIPISVFVAVIIAMFFYLVCAIVAKCKYAILFKIDPALTQPITFVVSKEGFGAVESIIYTGSDLIPWTEAAYYIETNYMYIVIKNKKAVFWLPKRLFSKEDQIKLADFIAAKLQQK